MMRRTWKPIAVLATGVLLALAASVRLETRAGTQDTRDQWAREALRILEGEAFVPPACVTGQEMFTDVPATSTFCPWIEELARRSITSGCTATEYCPGNPVNRAQMAVFIVKAMEACPTMDPTDEMVLVGGVCIDKYEASVWDAPNGGAQLVTEAEIDAVCSNDGQDCKGRIFARSVAGVEPARRITWFQAQQALANSGKRLPSNAEWQMAVSGTPDGAPCVVSGDVQSTGADPGCVSDWGAFDMVGNVWEWVADWDEEADITCQLWPAPFGDDETCIGQRGPTLSKFPGALIRGGGFFNGFGAGPFAVIGWNRPSTSLSEIGFRGAR